MSHDLNRSRLSATQPKRHTAYAMEVNDSPIGVAMSVTGGFVFHATDRSYFPLDGRRFRHVNQVSRAVHAFARDLPGRRPSAPRSGRR